MAQQIDQASNQLMRHPAASHQVSYMNTYENDDDATLEQRALEAKNVAQSARKSIPPFVQKLSSFLDESRNTDLIRWSEKGDSFIVLDEDEFARTMIPELFKHNNYASFVRQLNMYGFHKRVGLSDNSMRASERKNKTPSEYYNPYFKRGRPLLLWLIQKPKPLSSKSKGGKIKQEDAIEDEGEELFDGDSGDPIDAVKDESLRDQDQPLMIGNGNRGLKQNDLEAVNASLRQIRLQQQYISNMLGKIRRDHDQQAREFSNVHNQHENSINAILAFLATWYKGGQVNSNVTSIYPGTLPHDLSQPGNIVNIGEFGVGTHEGAADGLVRRHPRRHPLLLQAPPPTHQGATEARATSYLPSGQPLNSRNTHFPESGPNTPRPSAGVVEEIYDADTPQSNAPNSNWTGTTPTRSDIMSLINSTNAQIGNTRGARMDFPETLSQLQNADSKSPLSPQQRDSVLQLMANTQGNSGAEGSSNALHSPAAPDVPSLEKWNATERQLQALERTLKEQGENVAQLSNMLQPLSPSGSIPGLEDGQYMPPPDGLDLNQLFDTDQYFNESGGDLASGLGSGNGFDFDNGGNYSGADDFNFDNPAGDASAFNWDDHHSVPQDGPIVEQVSSSEATSPAKTAEESQGGGGGQNPRKRRRHNR